jgi:hypothetical protein
MAEGEGPALNIDGIAVRLFLAASSHPSTSHRRLSRLRPRSFEDVDAIRRLSVSNMSSAFFVLKQKMPAPVGHARPASTQHT